jgi:phage terminase large subunit-like protein
MRLSTSDPETPAPGRDEQNRTALPGYFILIEDKGSGSSLIQELRDQQIAVIPILCQDDKVTRSGSFHETT